MKTEKGAVGRESAAETKQKEKTGCQENDGRTATNTHSKLQTQRTQEKRTLSWTLASTSYCETLRPDSLGREHLLLTADSALVRKNYRTVSVLNSAAGFFFVWDSRTFKGSEGDLRSPTKYWILYVYYSVYYFIILFLRSWERGKYIGNSALMGALVFIRSCLRVHIVLCIIK